MPLSQKQIESIQQLAQAASTLSVVTNSDAATRMLLRHIEDVASEGCQKKPVPPTVAERIEKIQQSEDNKPLQLYGLLRELSQDPETKLGDLKLIALALGYRGVMAGLV